MVTRPTTSHPATYWMTGNTLRVDGGENIVGWNHERRAAVPRTARSDAGHPARPDVRDLGRRCTLEAGRRPLLGRRSPVAPVALGGTLLPVASRSLPGGGPAGVRAGRRADVPGDL